MNYLYRYTPPAQPQKNSAYVGILSNGDAAHLLPNEDAAAVLIGHWDNDGTLHVMDEPAYLELRPLGNMEVNEYDENGDVIGTRTGVATDMLDLHSYQGHAQRKLQSAPVADTYAEYPDDKQPFTLRVTRTQTLDDAWPHIPWGWTVEMLSDDPARDIMARAIGVYDENDTYLYTTGAFVLMDFEETDDEGEPITVQRYATVCPVGQRTANPDPVYFKLLLGSAPEGAFILDAPDEGASVTRLFWAENQ